MSFLRSLLYAAIFYPGTVLLVLTGLFASLFGRGPTLAVVRAWVDFHFWLTTHLLGIRTQLVGDLPPGPLLIAAKHQSMFETLEMVRLANQPVMVMKKELADIPLFGLMTRQYGVIPVERSAGAKALRAMVVAAKEAIAANRPIIIFPEGTRVSPGQMPPLRSGFAGLYRALNLPVVPVAINSGRLWGEGFVKRSGTVTFLVGKTIPAGLNREEIEERVHDAINALELAPETRT